LHIYQKTAKPRSQATDAENLVKFRRVVTEICMLTDRQTDRQTCSWHYTLLLGAE